MTTEASDTPSETYGYFNSLAWLAEFVKRRAKNTPYSEEQLEAQVNADLKKLLDQDWKPH